MHELAIKNNAFTFSAQTNMGEAYNMVIHAMRHMCIFAYVCAGEKVLCSLWLGMLHCMNSMTDQGLVLVQAWLRPKCEQAYAQT
jgi:hypothetical protein